MLTYRVAPMKTQDTSLAWIRARLGMIGLPARSVERQCILCGNNTALCNVHTLFACLRQPPRK